MLKIYGVAPSIHTRKVIVVALEKHLEYQIEPVFPFDPPAGWLAISPTGKIPAIRDDDFALADSSVIVAYLEKKYPQRPLLPTNPRDHALALWVEEFCDGNIAPNVITLFQQLKLGPAIHQRAADAALVADIANVQLPPKFDYLEALLTGNYFVGDQLSIADITIASNLLIYHYVGFVLDAKRYPKLKAHFERMLKRESFKKALKAEEAGAQRFGFEQDFLKGIYQ
jgi:glutathione S-transferase